MKRISYLVVSALSLLLVLSCSNESVTELSSPNQKISLQLNLDSGFHYSLTFNGQPIIAPSLVELTLVGAQPLTDFEVMDSQKSSVKQSWQRVWGKRKQVTDHYNQLKLELKEKKTGVRMDLYLRAYDDGVALRYGFPKQEGLSSIEIASEKTQFNFAKNYEVWRADYQTYQSSQEQEFLKVPVAEIQPQQLIGMPLLVKASETAYAVVTEANLTDWSGAFLRAGKTANSVVTDLAPYPSQAGLVVKRATPALSPWRVVMLAESPAGLIESDLISNLNDPVAYADTSWITPGASAWDWWWSNKYAPGADFELGANQATMQYFIDFAAKMGWQYQIVDWQWYGEPFAMKDGEVIGANPDVDITTYIDGINIPELVQYANSKGVKLIIWLHWEHLQNQLDEALALYEQWGVSGIKVDFMDRQDQPMVNFYHEVAKKAAKHHLIVDFHGAYKPTGVSRTYPNLMTREGVMGNEYSKWSNRVTPEHNVTLAFTRGLLGEMDYTPVAFRNVTPEQFVIEGESEDGSPRVQSTRVHQLAMAVVYESAFNVFCDSPDNYGNHTGTDFLKAIPTSWDETKVLNAEVGDYVTIARKSGNSWYIGSMTDATERTLTLDLSFLGEGDYRATLFEDGPQANQKPTDATQTTRLVTAKESLKVKLAQGGGFAAKLEKVN